jgi:hypothetical protein
VLPTRHATHITNRLYHNNNNNNNNNNNANDGNYSTKSWIPSWAKNGIALSIPVMSLAYYYASLDEGSKNDLLPYSFNCLTAGEPILTKNKILDTGADILQRKKPIDSIGMHLCAIHFYSGDLNRQLIAHHYCTHLTQDVHQCVIYDTDKPDARLIGVEYIISERLYKTLPEDEKKLWHSHAYEVKSGQLTMPGLPPIAEHAAMNEIVNTYGKTWHFWQVDRGDTLPLGAPKLMMSLTQDGQINPGLAKELNEQTMFTSIEDRRQGRADIQPHPVDPSANAWEKGESLQLELKKL